MKIGEKLRKIRALHGLTQQHVAAEIGVSTSQYCKYEKDETPITLEMLDKISCVFKVGHLDILKWDERHDFNFNFNNNEIEKYRNVESESSFQALVKQLQEENSFLKNENVKLWNLIDKLH